MKKMLSALSAVATLGFAGALYSTAFAGPTCCPVTGAANKDAGTCPATEAAKKDAGCCPETQAIQARLTDKADFACSAAGGCDTLTASAESVDMAKGGAAEGGVERGYGLNKMVPDFSLEDIHGNTHTLSEYRGKIVSLIFWNQRCPWVVEMDDRLADFTERYQDEVVVLAIDAGINNSVEDIKEYGKGFPFHLLLNRDSNLARKFDAKFTPEVFLLDKEGVVVYHGAFDNSRSGSDEDGTRRSYMEDAVKDVLAGNTPDVVQTRAFGCTIKFAPEQTAMADE